ncbi:unnamed protein product, partial [Penicillium egyptiacum]
IWVSAVDDRFLTSSFFDVAKEVSLPDRILSQEATGPRQALELIWRRCCLSQFEEWLVQLDITLQEQIEQIPSAQIPPTQSSTPSPPPTEQIPPTQRSTPSPSPTEQIPPTQRSTPSPSPTEPIPSTQIPPTQSSTPSP